MRKQHLSHYIKIDPFINGPYSIVMCTGYHFAGLWEVQGSGERKHGNWYTTFNGNSKQRRQQRRKLIRDLNQ